MKLLLDTHAFLWFASGSKELSARARRAIENPAHIAYLSVASAWEMAIKLSLGKLTLGVPLDDLIERGVRTGIVELAVRRAHVLGVATLPWHHRDPFDRLLVSQALVEGLQLVSADVALDRYPVRRLW